MSLGISEGIVTGHNEVFLLSIDRARELALEAEMIRPCIRGRQIRRFSLEDVTEVVIYPYGSNSHEVSVLPEVELKKYRHVWQYLSNSKSKLAGRGYFEASNKRWYELWCQRDMQELSSPKIVVAELADTSRFCIAGPEYFYGDTVCGITLRPDVREDLRFVLALLNSKLIEYVFKKTTVPKANGFFIYKTMFLKNLPLVRINFADPDERAAHDQVVKLVERASVAASQGKGTGNLEKEMDRHIYGLYNLTDPEISIIEAAIKRG
jgi:hypothetical protein